MKHRYVGIALALACAIALAAVSPASAVINLLANPGFEDAGGSYNGWFTFGTNVLLSLPAGDNIIRTGAAAGKIYGAFPLCPGPGQFNVSGCGQAFTPTAGAVYEFSGYSFMSHLDVIPGSNTCTGNRMVAKIVFFNMASGGAEIASNEIVIGDFDTPTDAWIPFSISAPAPPGALRVEALVLYLQPACDGGAVYVDDLSFGTLTAGPSGTNNLANPSFAGGLTGWTFFGNVYYDARSWAGRTPAGAAKMYSTFNPAFNSGMFQQITLPAPQTTWQLDLHIMTTCMETPILGANTNYVMARIVFLDASGLNELGYAEDVVLDNTAPLGTWMKHTVTGTAPVGAVYARPYVLFISPNSEGGSVWVDDVYFGPVIPTGVRDTPAPVLATIHPNVPNPFGRSTRIDFDLSQAGQVDISVYDVAGRRVATLSSGARAAGTHAVTWNGTSANGEAAPSGVYWLVLRTPGAQSSRRMVLLR